MENFLGWLINELENITTFADIEEEVREGEVVICELGQSDHIRNLFTLKHQIESRISSLLPLSDLSVITPEMITPEIHRLHYRLAVIEQIFWHEVREAAGAETVTGLVALRRGFKLVQFEQGSRHADATRVVTIGFVG